MAVQDINDGKKNFKLTYLLPHDVTVEIPVRAPNAAAFTQQFQQQQNDGAMLTRTALSGATYVFRARTVLALKIEEVK